MKAYDRLEGSISQGGGLLRRLRAAWAKPVNNGPTNNGPGSDEFSDPALDAGHHIRLGLGIMVVFFGGFGLWASLAPINSAVMATGIIMVDSHRKLIQHSEGGVVRQILVRDGDQVSRGQVLVRLDELRPRANLDALQGDYLSYRAQEARLLAERDHLKEINFPDDFLAHVGDPKVAQMAIAQEQLFRSRRREVQGKSDILASRVGQLEKVITGLEAQLRSLDQQNVLIIDELKAVQELYDKGFERMPRLRSLQRAVADLAGQSGRIIEEIGRNRIAISENGLQIKDIETSYRTEASKGLEQLQSPLIEVGERLRSARDVVEHLEIRAPEDGIIVNTQVFTLGGVLQPGAPILSLVPLNDKLVIDAQLRPDDVDSVTAGMAAQVHLTAFKLRSIPKVDGKVVTVSADRLMDEKTGMPYYAMRVEIDRQSLAALGPGHELHPGMPADVAIPTGERTMIQYMMQPLTQSMGKAFREH